MPSRLDCLDALRVLATTCAGVTAGERCLIVTDTAADPSIVDAMAGTLRTLGCDVVTVASAPADLPGDDPPPAVGAAMLEADVVFELTSVFIGSCPARRLACEKGARYLTVPGLSWTTLRRGGPFAADFHAVGVRAVALGNRLDAAAEFRLRSDAGTDLQGSFEGRRGRPLWGIAAARAAMRLPRTSRSARAPSRGAPRDGSWSTAHSSSSGRISSPLPSSFASRPGCWSTSPVPTPGVSPTRSSAPGTIA
jgi:hypothetical protein